MPEVAEDEFFCVLNEVTSTLISERVLQRAHNQLGRYRIIIKSLRTTKIERPVTSDVHTATQIISSTW
jgi:hypothetical protein